MEGEDPCDVAYDYLEQNEVRPINQCLPSGAASLYVPARKIKTLLEEEPKGLTLHTLFVCPCRRCTKDGGSVDDRATNFGPLREQELRGEYAIIYAVLISARRPALIQKFQKHGLKLQGTSYLCEGNFEVLCDERIDNFEVVRRKVMEKQYSFLVRTLRPYSDIKSISAKELLPIEEDLQPKGEGTFAEVRCFKFQHDEYRSREFGEHITKFARKLFKHGMTKSAAKEWNNLQRLSKLEDHPHLMVALGGYWHGHQFFILQEAAELSLHDYLKGEGDEFESGELWKQMKGIADGLATLHKIYKGTKIAYHQDLKPANILIVKRIFKIADFGLLEFKPVPLDDETGATGIPNAHNTGYYAAPRQEKYTRDCDIWSLGCIMSEVATCDIQGREGVKSYKDARIKDGPSGKDTPRFFSGQNVKSAVLQRHSSIHTCAQSQAATNRNTASLHFQKSFYTKEFFILVNSMLRKIQNSSDTLVVPGKVCVPDAELVTETIEKLRRGAVPQSTLENRVVDLHLKQNLPNPEALNSAMYVHLTSLTKVLSWRNKRKFSSTSLAGLKQHIVNLQAKQHAERRQQGLKRLSSFLERFEQFSELIKSLPDANEFMGFIWGPARYLLETTDANADAFREILGIYDQLGKIQPSLSMYKELLADEQDLTQVISATYSDICLVTKWLMLYFQQRHWINLFHVTWKRHRSRFTNVITRIASRFNLVKNRSSFSPFDPILDESTQRAEQLVNMLDSESLVRRQAVEAWLKPTDMENEQYHLSNIRAASPGTCRWLLDHETFQEWFDLHHTTTIVPKLLWLDGKPGAGKTVLASLIVEEARKQNQASTVLFFYFKQKDGDRNQFLPMARTFLMQILEQNPHILDYLYSKCCNGGRTLLTSRTLIEELLTLALGNCDSAYIVLDGLDECCSRKERGEIVSWFRNLIDNQPPEVRDRFRCAFISQNDSARKDYRDMAQITVDENNNEEDIELFCRMQSKKLISKLGISDEKANEVAASVSTLADGIFLFAHLVWVNLCGQTSIYGLEHELQLFPADLDKLDCIYARIMQTIVDKTVRAERDEALMLLSWLVCAKRSLKMHEIQTMKSVDLGRRCVEFESRRFRVDPRDLCESLVEVREDGTVELVHMTAKSYLANSDYFNVAVQELHLATLCIDYLNLPSFSLEPSERDVYSGEYGYMEYAVLYWLQHLESALTLLPSEQEELCVEIAESLEIFVERHWNRPTANINPVPNRLRKLLQPFTRCQKYPEIQATVILTDRELKHFGDMRPEQTALDLANVVAAVRKQIENVFDTTTDHETLKDLAMKYGIHQFRCPRLSCNFFSTGFDSREELKRHIDRHDRPARCTDENCRGSKIGFATNADLEKHLRENHPDTAAGRQYSFPTEEEIDQSVRENFEEPVPEPEPESEPEPGPQLDVEPAMPFVAEEPERIPQPNEVSSEPAQPRAVMKRQRTKQDFECAYCGKKFTKKFNWQSHLTSHSSDSQQHVCTQCGKTCARSGDLLRHMKLHDPSSSVSCGGTLSNGYQWGCGKSFARADILQTHYKSKRGKQCIADRDSQELAGSSNS